MINHIARLPFSAFQVRSTPGVRVELVEADFRNFMFTSKVSSSLFTDVDVRWGGNEPGAQFSKPEAQLALGKLVARGDLGSSGHQFTNVPYLNALANVKIISDTASVLIAKILALVAKDNLLVVSAGPTFKLVQRQGSQNVRFDIDREVSLYMATNPGQAVLNQGDGSAMADSLFSYSHFTPHFLRELDPASRGAEPLRALYARVVEETKQAAMSYQLPHSSKRYSGSQTFSASYA